MRTPSILIALLAAALVGCEQQGYRLDPVASSRAQATFSHGDLGNPPTEVLEIYDERNGFAVQRITYFGFDGFAILDVMSAGPNRYFETRAMRTLAQHWFPDDATFTWHADGTTPEAGPDARWLTFTVDPVDDSSYACVAGLRVMRRQASDVVGQEANKVLAGTYCIGGRSEPFPADEARAIAAAMRPVGP